MIEQENKVNKEMDMREVLEKVKQGEISVEEAEHYFRKAPFDEMGYAKPDRLNCHIVLYMTKFLLQRYQFAFCLNSVAKHIAKSQ